MRSLVRFFIFACVFALLAPVAPVRTQAPARKKLLFLTHAALYKHTSLGPAEKAVTELGAQGGFDVTTLEGYKQESAMLDLSFLTPEYLAVDLSDALRAVGEVLGMVDVEQILDSVFSQFCIGK